MEFPLHPSRAQDVARPASHWAAMVWTVSRPAAFLVGGQPNRGGPCVTGSGDRIGGGMLVFEGCSRAQGSYEGDVEVTPLSSSTTNPSNSARYDIDVVDTVSSPTGMYRITGATNLRLSEDTSTVRQVGSARISEERSQINVSTDLTYQLFSADAFPTGTLRASFPTLNNLAVQFVMTLDGTRSARVTVNGEPYMYDLETGVLTPDR
ncbi:MAG TPA: hypothetical protein VEI97_15210 [bacterium]|nr:hypothetical protein [bacterium]